MNTKQTALDAYLPSSTYFGQKARFWNFCPMQFNDLGKFFGFFV